MYSLGGIFWPASVMLMLLFGTATVGNCDALAESDDIPELFRVAAVAYNAFEDRLKDRPGATTEFEAWIKDIKNYEIRISQENTVVAVVFLPRQFRGGPVAGGGGKYTIDARAHDILEFEPYR